MNYIYALIDPITEQVRYVGKTNNISDRMKRHLGNLNVDPNKHKVNWIKKLLRQGFKPILVVLEECGDDWPDREKCWIKHYR